MSQSDVTGSLASGGRYRATSYLVELTDAAGEIVATFDVNDISSVQRNGQTVILKRAGNADVSITASSLDDAGRLEQFLRSSLPSVTTAASANSGGGFGKFAKWGCFGVLGIFGLIVIGGVIVFLAGGDSEGESDDPVVAVATTTSDASGASTDTEDATATTAEDSAETPTVEQIATESAAAETSPTTEPTDVPDEPTSEPTDVPASTPEPEPAEASGVPGSGRSNPLPRGETGQTDEWEVQILEVIRGADAYSRLVEANQFNEPAPTGYEYVLVNLRVKYIGDSAEAQSVDSLWLRSTGDARVKYGWTSVVQPEPSLDAELFPDGEATGWTTVIAREGETNLLGVFEPLFSIDEGDEIFLALDEGANVQMLTERLAEENDLGFDRASPAPLGERVVGETWELWAIESVRGEEALARVKETNQFNEDPAPGMEYVLVHVGARNVNPDAGADSIDDFSFKLTGDAGRVYDNPSVVNPEPDFDFDVYAGGEIDGWITLQCAEGEQNLRVVYEPAFSFTAQPRYFALE